MSENPSRRTADAEPSEQRSLQGSAHVEAVTMEATNQTPEQLAQQSDE